MEVLNLEYYEAFLSKRLLQQKEKLAAAGEYLISDGDVIARWEGDVIVLPKIENPSKRQTTHRNGVMALAKVRQIEIREE